MAGEGHVHPWPMKFDFLPLKLPKIEVETPWPAKTAKIVVSPPLENFLPTPFLPINYKNVQDDVYV